ncbi:UNVERIFIED_CONTAM: hypothetical protein K2H54_076507 [Gekko kuhli]
MKQQTVARSATLKRLFKAIQLLKMVGLLLFILAVRDSAAIVTPGDPQMEIGPALGKLLVDSPGFLLLNFTLGTQLLNLSPDPSHIILWDHKKLSGVFSDVSEDGLHQSSSQLRMTMALECLGDAERKLQLDGGEVQAWTGLDSSLRFNLLDVFIMVSELSQGAHLMSAELPSIGALKASVVGSQAQLSNQKRLLRGGRSTLDKTTVLVILSSDFLSYPSMIDTQQLDWLRCEEAADLQLVLCVSSEAWVPSYLMEQKAPERIQSEASPGEMRLSSVQAEVTQGIEFAFTVYIFVEKMETRFLFSSLYVSVRDTRSQKSLPSVGYRLGGSNVEFDSTPSLAYQETAVPRYWLPEIHAPQTTRGYYLSFRWPRLRGAIKKHRSVARIQKAHPQGVADTLEMYDTLLPILNRWSINVTLLHNMVQAMPPGSSMYLWKPVWDPSDPEDPEEPSEYLYLFHSPNPHTKQLFYRIIKNQKDRVDSLVPDDDSQVSHYSLLSYLPALFYVAFSFFLTIVFMWMLENWCAMHGNWPELYPNRNENRRQFRREIVAAIRYFFWNVLGIY